MEVAKTVEEINGIEVVDPAKHTGKVAAVAFAGYTFDAVDMVITALALPLIMKEWGLNMMQAGTVVTALLIGACFGGFIFGPIADKFGRKKALMWCIAFFSITTGLAGFATDHFQLAVLRFVAGLGLGAEWALGTTMIAEFYAVEKRGKASSWMMIGWPVGYFIALGLQAALVPLFGWRALFFAGTTGMILAAYIWLYIPESPVWLRAQAKKKLGASTANPVAAVKLTDLFKPANIKITSLTTTICLCALMTYWAVNTWLPTLLLQERGLKLKGVILYLVMFNIGNVIGFLFGGRIGDKLGKRNVMVVSGVLSAIMFYVWLGMTTDMTLFLWLGVLYHAVGATFWATLPAFIAEQFPTNIRAFGTSTSYSAGRFASTLIPMALGAAAMKYGLSGAIAFMAVFYLIASAATFMLRDRANIEA
jgi:MFS family permease